MIMSRMCGVLSSGDAVTLLSCPENVRAKVLSPSSVWLHWTDPSLGREQQLTDNRYYNVHYQVTQPAADLACAE